MHILLVSLLVACFWIVGCERERPASQGSEVPLAPAVELAHPEPVTDTVAARSADAEGGGPYADLREQMVQEQLRGRDITDEQVLSAMARIPRHEFVPDYDRQAYQDRPLPIGHGQTISQPYIVALMTQKLGLDADDKVLEIGTGSGYQAAVLAELVEQVYTIEIIQPLAEHASEVLAAQNYEQVEVRHADGYFGWPEQAPFDAVIITAAPNHIPPPLIKQLKPGGRLIVPLASARGFQSLTLVTKQADGSLQTQVITGVMFVPMTGQAQQAP